MRCNTTTKKTFADATQAPPFTNGRGQRGIGYFAPAGRCA